MNISWLVGIADNALKSYRPVVCASCGSETLTGSDITFCSNCESVVSAESQSLESGDPSLFSSLNSIRTAVAKGDFEAAASVYDQLLKDRPSPQLLYAFGMMKIEHSNHMVSQIRYDGEGFMEHNAELRAQGSLLVSDAKRLISKCISFSAKESADAPSAYVLYRMFLCDLKMNDLRSAGVRLARIQDLEKDGPVGAYAKVVLDSNAGLNGDAAKELERLFKSKTPPANAFYYAAFNAFKLGDPKGAERLAVRAGNLVDDLKRARLLQEIDQASTL
jgi:hypothetical protein